MLRFSPYAWNKLICLRDMTTKEVGAFGLSDPSDLLAVNDLIIPKQEISSSTVDFDDDGLADLMDEMVQQGYQPCQFYRIWIHTHPSNSASPSNTDRETFREVFGSCDWAVMFILAQGGQTHCEFRFNKDGLRFRSQMPHAVDHDLFEDYESVQEQFNEQCKNKVYTATAYGAQNNYNGQWNGGAQTGGHVPVNNTAATAKKKTAKQRAAGKRTTPH